MSVSDAEFAAWLLRSEKRVVLCEMDYVYEGAGSPGGSPTIGTLYFADYPYIDEVAGRAYDDCVVSLPSFSRSLDRAKLGGKTSRSFGSLELNNAAGRQDYLLDLACDGSNIAFYVGAPTWARADFRLAFSAFTEKMSAPSPARISISLKDSGILLNKTIGGDTLVGGTGPNKDRFKPVNLGYVHSAECLLSDAALLVYVYADRSSVDIDFPTQVLAVRDRGANVLFTDNADGTFTLAASPDSPIIVAEVFGTDGDASHYHISDLLEELVANRAGITAAGLWNGPHASFVQYDDEDFHYGLSIVDGKNIVDELEDICISGLIFWSVTRDNKVTYGRIRPTTAYIPQPSQLTIVEDDIVPVDAFRIELGAPQYSTINVYGNKRWIVLTDIASGPDLGPTASLAIKGYYYAQPDPVGDSYASAPQLYHKTLTASPPIETILSAPSDEINPPLVPVGSIVVADTLEFWAAIYRQMFLPWIEFIEITVGFRAYALEIGDIVTVQMNRFGLDAGELCQVIGIELRVTEFKVGLTLVRRREGTAIAGPGGGVTAGVFWLMEDGVTDILMEDDETIDYVS